MFFYFNSTFSSSCVSLVLPVSAMRKAYRGLWQCLLLSLSYCCLPRASFCALNHPSFPSHCNELTCKNPFHVPSKLCANMKSLLPVTQAGATRRAELRCASVPLVLGDCEWELAVLARGGTAHTAYCLPMEASRLLSLSQEFAIYQ